MLIFTPFWHKPHDKIAENDLFFLFLSFFSARFMQKKVYLCKRKNKSTLDYDTTEDFANRHTGLCSRHLNTAT